MLRSPLAKLTEETVEEIYIELRGTESIPTIALMFGVSIGLVHHINTGQSWSVRWYTYPIRKKQTSIEDIASYYPLEDSYPCQPFTDQWGYE
tara:strand:- start:966 stop:1241 length:276 start_codon:yes stop_codon:yes gene_type:complete